jgi:tRNA dimethylallyltransferase
VREKRVLILTGPTGVGKTDVAILIAKALDTEIISADSMQIYKGMDIGTAKPTKEQLSQVKHHMIDIIEPSESYSVGRYIKEVKPIIERLHSLQKVPLVVGGTGLYIKAMTRGLFEAPEANPELRKQLKEIEERNPGTLYAELQRLDPQKAKEVSPTDLRRIIRALEVIMTAERPMSSLQRELTSPLPYQFYKIGLTRDRKELYRIIEKRVEEMFNRGLVEEVERLLKKNPTEVALQAIGYKEVIAYLRGETELEETIRVIKKATKRYAKRQFTWFRKEEAVQWVDITGLFDPEEIFQKIIRETNLKEFIDTP